LSPTHRSKLFRAYFNVVQEDFASESYLTSQPLRLSPLGLVRQHTVPWLNAVLANARQSLWVSSSFKRASRLMLVLRASGQTSSKP